MAKWQRARVIPVTGIDTEREAEGRATSALLAVLSVVRDLSDAVLSPFGASTAKTAEVDTFVEPPFTLNGKSIRPDGVVSVTYGKRNWSALVEVKTGQQALSAEQVNRYWDLARHEGFDSVITISNEIPPVPGAHPTDGLRVQANSPVKVHHLSWTWLLATAVNIKTHKGVEDPEQAWILEELIRYLEHPHSGALAFDDMGPHWVQARSNAREGRLAPEDEATADIVQRWDQLLRFIALTLGSDIGEDVQQVLPRKHARDPRVRATYLAKRLAEDGQLDGALRIPNTAGDVELLADLKGQMLSAQTEIDAPTDRGARARGTWLTKQLPDAPGDLRIEAYEKNARTPVEATLAELRDDRSAITSDARKDPVRLVLNLHVDMGLNRRSGGKNPSFVESVKDLVETFYRDVVQTITPWSPPPPKLPDRPAPSVEPPRDWRSMLEDTRDSS